MECQYNVPFIFTSFTQADNLLHAMGKQIAKQCALSVLNLPVSDALSPQQFADDLDIMIDPVSICWPFEKTVVQHCGK